MPIVSYPNPPERVRAGHGYPIANPNDGFFADGYKAAVRQILGEDAWFALICDLDGNPLPTLRIPPVPPAGGAA